MDNEFVKKVGREAFEKLSKQTQAIILECSDHQKWLDTEQTKLDYIYSLAQRYPIYQKYGGGMAEETERKIQRAFQTLVIEGRSEMNTPPMPMVDNSGKEAAGNSTNSNSGSGKANSVTSGNQSSNLDNGNFSLEDDLELSLEGL
ncbi:MAG: hypothetical protein F6K30_12510 [Cyanothece sp. SIO2G6]|nr:hypothetical protein [Cyanothece sp. SIO2G6]